MKAHILTLGLLLTGCLNWQENPTHHYSLYVDPQFTSDQVNQIMAAANDWEDSSGKFLTFDGAGVKDGQDTISIYADSNIAQDCSSGAIGCEKDEGVDSNIYLPANVSDPVFFKQIAGHELGHSLGMPHIATGNLLCADRGCAALTVQCGDLQELAIVWNNEFDPNALSLCQNKQ